MYTDVVVVSHFEPTLYLLTLRVIPFISFTFTLDKLCIHVLFHKNEHTTLQILVNH